MGTKRRGPRIVRLFDERSSLFRARAGLERAAQDIMSAEAILIGAGAGMGVDSGLPDFRGGQGFWQAYPPYEKLGLDFVTLANPRWFRDDPMLAWGFYGHRLMLYRQTEPHGGFAILRRWMRADAARRVCLHLQR